MRIRTPKTGVAVAATALLLALPLHAEASSGTHGMKTVDAHTNWTEPSPVILPSTACPGPDCGFQAHGTTTYNGPGMFGTEDYSLYGAPDSAHPGVLEFHGTVVVYVTKSRCGAGIFKERVTDGTADYSTFDPFTQKVHMHDTWTIIPGSGTGQLVGITGTGTDDVDDASFTLAGATGDPEANKGVHDGTVTCRLH